MNFGPADDQLLDNRGTATLDPGEDELDGGNNGNDMLDASGDDDTLHGGAGDDLLDGGVETDNGDGGLGSDTCIELKTQTSCGA